MASAPTTRSTDSRLRSGSIEAGSRLGWCPTSSTRATLPTPRLIKVGISRASIELKPRYGRPVEQRRRGLAPYAYQGRGEVDARVEEDVQGFPQRVGPRLCSQQIGDLAEDDVDRYAGEESDHDRVRYEAGVPTQLEELRRRPSSTPARIVTRKRASVPGRGRCSIETSRSKRCCASSGSSSAVLAVKPPPRRPAKLA